MRMLGLWKTGFWTHMVSLWGQLVSVHLTLIQLMLLAVILWTCAWPLGLSYAPVDQQVGVRQLLFCLPLLPVELAPDLIIA
jgi:hypothetical protein